MSCRKASPRRRGKAGNGSLSSARNTRGRSDSVLAANAGCLITFVHGAPSLGAYTRYWIAALDRVTHPTTFFSRSKRRKANGKLFTDHRRGRPRDRNRPDLGLSRFLGPQVSAPSFLNP